MKMKDQQQEWSEADEVWDLLGKAAPKEAGGRFTDDTVRAVKLLPEADPWWPKILRFSPVAAVAACAVFGVVFLMNGNVAEMPDDTVTKMTVEERWDQIEEVADAEMISAAVDHLDDFSDDELITMIGF
ncbi:MAG: hypothetical protein ACSHX7_07360 [Luteolibacter sp.]